MHILIIEDDQDLAAVLRIGLTRRGHSVEVVHDGTRGERKARHGTYDALIVDWMLPGQDGLSLIKRVRDDGSTVPIIMLTAKDGDDSLVAGLDAGADDFITKPVTLKALSARLRALTRRASSHVPEKVIEIGPLHFDVLRRLAHVDGTTLDLRTKEYMLLELLARRAGKLVTRQAIISTVWGEHDAERASSLNVTVSTLRRKLEQAQPDGHRVAIDTVRGLGYRLHVS